MKLKPFAKFLIEADTEDQEFDTDSGVGTTPEGTDAPVKPKKNTGINIPKLTLVKTGGEHPDLPNALSFNGKNMFYSFDLTNTCNRGCPACYVDRAKETGCNAVANNPLKEYKGDIRKWEHDAKTPEQKAKLAAAKKDVNANGGIRMFSAADYPVVKDLNDDKDFYGKILKANNISDAGFFKDEVKAFLDDAQTYGWYVKAITKEPTFIKDHIDHPALKGVNVSMNSHGFGVPHDTVKSMKSGKDLDGVGGMDNETAHKIGKYGDKITGRTVTFTPFDLKTVLDHIKASDDAHIGVITSGHDVPGNGVRYIPSVPKDSSSPKKVLIQSNFPESLMHLINGDANAEITKGQMQSLQKAGHLKEMLRMAGLTLEEAKKTDAEPKYRQVMTLIHLNSAGVKVPADQEGTWTEVGGVYHAKEKKVITGDHIKGGSAANIVADPIGQFEKDNEVFPSGFFTKEDAEMLMKKMMGKMCCAGENENQPSGGKCSYCKVKCGVNGCGIEGKQTVQPEHLAHLLNDYSDTYNKLRNEALANLRQGELEVGNTTVKQSKPTKSAPEDEGEDAPVKEGNIPNDYRKFHGHEIDEINGLKKDLKALQKKKNPDAEQIETLQQRITQLSDKTVKESMKKKFLKFI